ncbi:MAG: LPS assembly lipoprotein LptE [Arenicellaceae bacterium]|nr:LPS assembly lipoprotein LptE [Arenicellaceae bacterium]
MRKLIILLVSVAIVSLASCGYRLRGQLPLAERINVLYIESRAGSFDVVDRFSELLSGGIEGTGAEIVTDPALAKAVLTIVEISFDRLVRTLDSRGKVNSYTLQYLVIYDLFDVSGDVISKGRALQELADFDFNPDLVIEKEEEEEAIRETMEDELVLRILRQLSTLG